MTMRLSKHPDPVDTVAMWIPERRSSRQRRLADQRRASFCRRRDQFTMCRFIRDRDGAAY
jgi:hypothetical protein